MSSLAEVSVIPSCQRCQVLAEQYHDYMVACALLKKPPSKEVKPTIIKKAEFFVYYTVKTENIDRNREEKLCESCSDFIARVDPSVERGVINGTRCMILRTRGKESFARSGEKQWGKTTNTEYFDGQKEEWSLKVPKTSAMRPKPIANGKRHKKAA